MNFMRNYNEYLINLIDTIWKFWHEISVTKSDGGHFLSIRHKSLHKINNDNGMKLVNFAISKTFSHCDVHERY